MLSLKSGSFVSLPSNRIGRVTEVESDGSATIISGYDIGRLDSEGTLTFRGHVYKDFVASVL
jgi:hypothetical protein